ncbi:MAG: hypothetical protein HYZ57_16740 [Acidobacteria bacterium]|nr:hypothetical protein [Acidobacteriota bacterium]MBI3281479.1 hypothetical protein [Acidobacteriota bacterium]
MEAFLKRRKQVAFGDEEGAGLDVGDAHFAPGGEGESVDQDLGGGGGGGGAVLVEEPVAQGFIEGGVLAGMMGHSAARPWRRALKREAALPSGVLGPVLNCALRRLAASWRGVMIFDMSRSWGGRGCRSLEPCSGWQMGCAESPRGFRQSDEFGKKINFGRWW